jgi:flagellar basal-body rod modification protein FlgD
MGKDEFMKLLIAQMQNQDPMNPMQGDQMAAQLAQFSTLEQMQEMNTTLTGQSTAQGALLGAVQSTSAINTLGHTVVAVGNGLSLDGKGGTTSVTADIGAAAKTTTVHILDSTGTEVATGDLGAVGAGNKQSFDITGITKGLPAGTYTYTIDAKDSAGAAVTTTTYMTGKVDGISSGANGIVLNSGSLSIPYANVVQVNN